MRQHDRATDDLIGLLGVDTEPNGDLDDLIHLAGADALRQPFLKTLQGSHGSLKIDRPQRGDLLEQITHAL